MTCNTINFIAKPIKTTRNPFADTGACKDSRVVCSDSDDTCYTEMEHRLRKAGVIK